MLEQGVTYFQKRKDNDRLIYVAGGLARVYRLRKKHDQAIKSYQLALATKPTDSDLPNPIFVFVEYPEALFEAGKYQEALDRFSTLVKELPDMLKKTSFAHIGYVRRRLRCMCVQMIA